MVHLQKLFVMHNSVSWFLLLRFNGCLSLFVSTAILLKEESYRVSMRKLRTFYEKVTELRFTSYTTS